MLGCHKQSAPSPSDDANVLRVAVEHGDWQTAWALAQKELIRSPGDMATMELAAQIAFEAGEKSKSADLLVEISRLNGLKDRGKFNSAFAGLMASGRLFDAMEWLEEGLQKDEDNLELRRLLFDLLVNTEQHSRTAVHRERLIRARAIDFDVLYAAYRYDVRNEETESLATMLERHPTDKRPLIAQARRDFDASRYHQAAQILNEIISDHPEFVSAQLLLGRTLVQLHDWKKLAEWISSQPEASKSDSDYWLILGDWAVQTEEPAVCAVFYQQACMLGPVRVEPWNKLSQYSEYLSAENAKLTFRRSEKLIQLNQNYAELAVRDFYAIDNFCLIANLLNDLGRAWEAEAWLALATSSPRFSNEDQQQAKAEREKLIANMNADQAWQLPEKILPGVPQASEFCAAFVAKNRDQTNRQLTNQDPAARFPGVVRPRYKPVDNIQLIDEASQRGLTFHGRTAGDLTEPGISIHEAMGCGGGVLDYDLDGWADIYLASAGGKVGEQNSSPNALFRNQSGRVLDVSEWADVDDLGFAQGICCGDPNEDGFEDILVLNYGPDRLFINQGDGTFTDQSTNWLPSENKWSTSAAFTDMNGDGFSDLFIAHYCEGISPSTEKCFSKDDENPRSCSPNHFSAEHDTLLLGTGIAGLEDMTKQSGLLAIEAGRGLGIISGQLDGNPGLDVYVANDMSPNHFWRLAQPLAAHGELKLVETAVTLGVATDQQAKSQASMGIAVHDFNEDRRPDFYVTNYENEYNTLYLSYDSSGWRDRTAAESLSLPTLPLLGFGTQAVDFDNNGTAELMVANGHVDSIRNDKGEIHYAQLPLVLGWEASGAQAWSLPSAYFKSPHVGRALWDVDFNRDGLIDMMVTHQTEPAALLINQSSKDYEFVSFSLVGQSSLRSAVGSVVTVHSGDHGSAHFLTSGNGYFCSRERKVHVGLGSHDSAVDVDVSWPSGHLDSWHGLRVGTHWLLVEGQQPFEF